MDKKMARFAAWFVLILIVLIPTLIACIYIQGRPAQGRPQYVAMGSSFAAGPAITHAADNSPWFCARSNDNYAHQLARLRGLSLVDVSCGGATTKGILGRGLLMLPAQIEAVTQETELVTVTIGGNDIDYTGNMMAMACDTDTPWYVRSIGGCKVRSMKEMEQLLPGLRDRLLAIIEGVHQRAPGARVVLLNYQTILPGQGTCERLGLTAGQVEQMRAIGEKLATTTAAAAKAGGALLMDAAQLTRAHDVCAPDPWMNGMHPPGGLLGAPLHPTLASMTAVAQGLNALLGDFGR